MMSPISEVKPSQVAQLTTENAKLKAEIEKLRKLNDGFCWLLDEELISEYTKEVKEENETLKKENEANQLTIRCLQAEQDYINPKGKYMEIENYSDFNDHLKKNYNDDMYKKMYDWFNMDDFLDEDEDEDK